MKYFLWILGCAMNYSDAERIAAVLDSLGYSKTEDEKEADLFITVACSVRQSAINRIYGKVRDLNQLKSKNPNFKTILSGCVLATDRKKMEKVFDVVFEIKDLEMLPQMLGNIDSSVISSRLSSNSQINQLPRNTKLEIQNSRDYLEIIPHYESDFRAYVPISSGCDNFCTYCAVPFTRGREKSRSMEEIIAEVKNLINSGYKEITLIGQNVNSYGNDLNKKLNTSFIQLLINLDKIKGDHRIYFYSNHPKDFSDELILCLKDLRHFPSYIHLPLQSGNDEIIKKMNRNYSKEKYLKLAEKIRLAMPDVTLTTDIIVGFPGETLEQFADTIEIMEKAKYDMAFIAQFSPRNGTIAAKMIDDVTGEEKRRREDVLQKILSDTALEHNKKFVGTSQKVLIDEKKGEKYFGRTAGFKVVEIKTDHLLELGQFINVIIEKATAWKLTGKLS